MTAGAGSSIIIVGSGSVQVSLPGGHGAATIGDVGISGSDTVMGFTPGQDLIFFSGQNNSPGGIRDQVIAAQTHPTAASTVLAFPDGSTIPASSLARWHFLYFLPLPHQQGSLRPSLGLGGDGGISSTSWSNASSS